VEYRDVGEVNEVLEVEGLLHGRLVENLGQLAYLRHIVVLQGLDKDNHTPHTTTTTARFHYLSTEHVKSREEAGAARLP
jgi:hypothetical protein